MCSQGFLTAVFTTTNAPKLPVLCFCLPSARKMGMYHQTQFMQSWGSSPGLEYARHSIPPAAISPAPVIVSHSLGIGCLGSAQWVSFRTVDTVIWKLSHSRALCLAFCRWFCVPRSVPKETIPCFFENSNAENFSIP